MICSVAVTYEFPLRAPLTYRIQGVKATSAATVMAKAMREAQKQLTPLKGWSSVVAIILDRQ